MKPRQLRIASIVACTLLFAVLAWNRRWMSDDGLIFVRTVRQILDGNGPVFNAFERAESGTSTLWTYLLVLLCAIIRLNPAYVAVYSGLVLAIAAVPVGMLAAARLHRDKTDWRLVPGGVLVVLAVYPFWDFATSGLETGLTFLWLALSWWLLVTVSPTRLLRSAIVWGLGPLVRPDLGIVMIAMFVAAWLLERPSWKRSLAVAAAALAIPFAYEIFRMGYYGTLVPLPAVAKNALGSAWGRGFDYLLDFERPYWLWIPVLLLGGLLGVAWKRGLVAGRERIIVGAPVLAGVVMCLYVIRMGGDFMHARMFLPALFLMLLPGFMLPLRRTTAPILGLIAVWGVVTVIRVADGKSHVSVEMLEDERAGYVKWTNTRNPIHPEVFFKADKPASAKARNAQKKNSRIVVSENTFLEFPMKTGLPGGAAYVAGRLGTGGEVLPLDSVVIDTLGLANPFGAHITPVLPEFPGHEKRLPAAWILADYGDDDATALSVSPALVATARRAMKCGDLPELVASARAPMTASRFWSNLTGAFHRTRIEFPADPALAEQALCPNPKATAVVTSHSLEFGGWSAYFAIDGVYASADPPHGFFSEPVWMPTNEWIELRFPATRTISTVVLYPALQGIGFPLEVNVQTWNGSTWVDAAKGEKPSPLGPLTLTFAPVETRRVRISAPAPYVVGWGFGIQFAEIETR